jgi:murein DD-endopeptidase MepM/ murein hydrolase activator NlpD
MLAGALALAGMAAVGLCWAFSSSAAALDITPSPTPCGLPPPLTCSLPTPLPTVGTSPTPTPAAPPGTTSSSGATATKAPAAAPPATGAATISAADIEVLQSALANPALVQQLVGILENPLASQRPDLLHFQPAASARHQVSLPKPMDAVLAGAALLLPLLWIAALPIFGFGRRPVAMAALLLPPVAAAAGVGGAVVVHAPRSTAVAAVVLPSRATAPPVRPTMRHAAAAPAAWTQLVSIERRLGSERSGLAIVEHRLDRLTAAVETDASVRPVPPRVFAALIAQHDAQAADYDQTLQQEYLLYRAAAQQPVLAQQLLSAAAGSGIGAAAHDVDLNLQTMETQLQQEAAISQAEARLAQLGLSTAQARTFQAHDSFEAPVGGPIGQPFGPTSFALEPPLVYQGHFYPHFHTGIDIEAPIGTPVVAAADGVVALVATSTDGHGHLVGYGNYVVVAHAHGYFTLYGHLSATLVTAGQVVQQGQLIGLVGSTGNSTGPHLHFEIRRDGEFLDPLPYVTGRLRPW